MKINVAIDKERCKGCEYCSSSCPKEVIRMSGDLNRKGYHFAIMGDASECSGCRCCALMCPEIAIGIKAAG